MLPGGSAAALAAAERAEQGYVRLLGGYTVGLPGGTLLVNERLPSSRFNVVQRVDVAPGRRTQFFEAALDHYFQRALRPRIRVAVPVPAHVAETLAGLGFAAAPMPELWLAVGPTGVLGRPPASANRVGSGELDPLVEVWGGPGERLELRRQIEVGLDHPNPGEQLAAFRSSGSAGELVSLALAYRNGDCVDLEAVHTVPAGRDRGAATALVAGILRDRFVAGAAFVVLRTEEPRLADRLATLGFEVVGRHAVFDLAAGADLRSRPGPSQGPFWRPPRG